MMNYHKMMLFVINFTKNTLYIYLIFDSMSWLVIFNSESISQSNIAWAGVKIGINFTSCSENGNFVVIATISGLYPKISLLPVLSQINTIASFVKVKISDASMMSSVALLLF